MIAALALFLGLGLTLDVSAQSDGGKISKSQRASKSSLKVTEASSSNAASSLISATHKSKQVATLEEADVLRRKPTKRERSARYIRKDAMD